jgi:hypothetical protein
MGKTFNSDIQLEDLQEFIVNQKVLFSKTSTKKLECTLYGNIEIWTKDTGSNWLSAKKVWEGMQPFSAIEFYNELP